MTGGASAMLEGGRDLPTARVFPNYPGSTWPTPPVNKRDKKTVTFLLFDAHLIYFILHDPNSLPYQCLWVTATSLFNVTSQPSSAHSMTRQNSMDSKWSETLVIYKHMADGQHRYFHFCQFFLFHAVSTLWLMLLQYFCHQELRDTACSLPLK